MFLENCSNIVNIKIIIICFSNTHLYINVCLICTSHSYEYIFHLSNLTKPNNLSQKAKINLASKARIWIMDIDILQKVSVNFVHFVYFLYMQINVYIFSMYVHTL